MRYDNSYYANKHVADHDMTHAPYFVGAKSSRRFDIVNKKNQQGDVNRRNVVFMRVFVRLRIHSGVFPFLMIFVQAVMLVSHVPLMETCITKA